MVGSGPNRSSLLSEYQNTTSRLLPPEQPAAGGHLRAVGAAGVRISLPPPYNQRVTKNDARQGADDTAAVRWAELIGSAQAGGAEASAAARALLEAFINGERNGQLTDYVARCLGEYVRGGIPIELALRMSSALPPVVLGPAGEGDRRRGQRASHVETEGSGKHIERRAAREQGGRGRNRRSTASGKAAPDKRGQRAERRRKAAAPASETD